MIENEIFKRGSINFNKIIEYIFKKIKNNYIYEKKFLDDNFKAVITINNSGEINGKVFDLLVDEEYTNIRTEMSGTFVNKVRDEYKAVLNDIKKNCFDNKYFIYDQANIVAQYIKSKYNIEPEFLWEKYPYFGIFRNINNNKWFALITNVDGAKFDNNQEIELLNIKLDRDKIKSLLNEKGFYKAYHMNKESWISIILNNTLDDEDIFKLIDESYNIINK